MITLADIQAARKTICDSVFLSPCAYSETFSRLTGNKIFFKLENLQMTGSFKERGAVNKLMSLTAAEREGGVVTASAGNHAQAGRCLSRHPPGHTLENRHAGRHAAD
jgi:threonine dehydratase